MAKKRKSKKPALKKSAPKLDPYDVAERGEKIAKERIAATAGFEDLADFYVMVYTDEELDEMEVDEDDRNWVGQYSRGSAEGPRGPVVLVNASSHAKLDEIDSPVESLADTLCHEMGHALWELLEDESRERWNQAQADHRWGPEEAFADDFMYYVSGRRFDMNDEKLFVEIAMESPEAPPPDAKKRPRHNPLADSDDLAQRLYDACFGATEVTLSEVNLSTADRGHPVVDEPERYRWFLISKFPVRSFGLRLEDLLRDAGPYASHEQWRHDKIVDLLRDGPAWPAVVTADGVLVDGFHRITANRTLRRKTMPVIVAVERSGQGHWDDMWIREDGD